MLLETGSEESCFPGFICGPLVHSNTHPEGRVCKNAVQGIGGFSNTHIQDAPEHLKKKPLSPSPPLTPRVRSD